MGRSEKMIAPYRKPGERPTLTCDKPLLYLGKHPSISIYPADYLCLCTYICYAITRKLSSLNNSDSNTALHP